MKNLLPSMINVKGLEAKMLCCQSYIRLNDDVTYCLSSLDICNQSIVQKENRYSPKKFFSVLNKALFERNLGSKSEIFVVIEYLQSEKTQQLCQKLVEL